MRIWDIVKYDKVKIWIFYKMLKIENIIIIKIIKYFMIKNAPISLKLE